MTDAQLVLDYVLHFVEHNNVVMEECSPLSTTACPAPRGRSTAGIADDVCEQAGLKCTLPGTVLFIRKRELEERPDEATQDQIAPR